MAKATNAQSNDFATRADHGDDSGYGLSVNAPIALVSRGTSQQCF